MFMNIFPMAWYLISLDKIFTKFCYILTATVPYCNFYTMILFDLHSMIFSINLSYLMIFKREGY